MLGSWLGVGVLFEGYSDFTQYVVRIETLIRGFYLEGILSEGILSWIHIYIIVKLFMVVGLINAMSTSLNQCRLIINGIVDKFPYLFNILKNIKCNERSYHVTADM